MPPRLTVIHLARKPLSGTVAATCLQHGTGAINIGASRIGAGTSRPKREVTPLSPDVDYHPTSLAGRVDGPLGSSKAVGDTTLGRWPANLILSHLQRVWYRLRADVPEVTRVQIHSHYGFDEALPAMPGRDSRDALGTSEAEVLLPEVHRGVMDGIAEGHPESGVGDPHLPALRAPLRGDSGPGTEWSQEVVLEAVPRSGEPPDQAFGEGPYGRVSGENGGGGHREAPDEQLLAVAGRQVQEQRVRPGDGGPVDSGTAGAGPADAHREAESAVHTGASASSRRGSGACSAAERGSSPSERGEGRQSTGEPGGSSSGHPLDAASGSRAGTSVVAGASASVDPGEHFLEVEAGNIPPEWQPYFVQHRVEGCRLVGTHHEDFLIQQYTDLLGNFSFYSDSDEAKSAVEAVPNGQEVEDWECVDGCPCLDLDRQSGVTRSAVAKEVKVSQVKGQFVANATTRPGINQHADEGGASRYFKQVQTDTDLFEYLRTMISPPWPFGQALVVEGWPEWLASTPKGSCTGFVLYGHRPTADQVAHLHSLLTPGGHICLIAPDDQPTGHSGAIALEDGGFEIRDALLWVRGPDKVHYVAKAARKEREAGCQELPAKKGFEAVERKEGSAGVKNPRAGAGRTADKVRNFHPCLHPEAVVMTDRGHRPIQTIQVGDKVLAADGLFHRVETITRHPYTSEFLYRIGVKGTNLTTSASDNHPFLIWRPTRKGNNIQGGSVVWASADQVVEGDYTMTPVMPMGSGTKKWPEDPNFWFVFGLWLAEGVPQVAGHGDNGYPSFSLHRKETGLVDRIKALTARNVSVYEHGENGIQVMAFDPELGAQFKALGGSGAATKTVHPDVWLLAEPQRRALVEGYIAGDGGTVRNYLQAKSVSTDLATQMTFLAESLGYKTNLFWFKAAPGKIGARHFKTTSPHYQMQFYSKDRAQTTRKAASPGLVVHEGVAYSLRYVQKVEKVPYQGDVVNLSVEGCPTFQTAVGMSHNTVKPIALMVRLLADVPKDQGPVLDPFLGAGTTLIACRQTGHSGIGIERETEYLLIAETRVRHWDRAKQGWLGVEIVSDLEPPKAEPQTEIELDDWFQ